MEKNIHFKDRNVARYRGRNGSGYMIGINILTGERVVYLTPVNTKGLANCEQQIPYEDIDAVIELLREAKLNQNNPYT